MNLKILFPRYKNFNYNKDVSDLPLTFDIYSLWDLLYITASPWIFVSHLAVTRNY